MNVKFDIVNYLMHILLNDTFILHNSNQLVICVQVLRLFFNIRIFFHYEEAFS